MLFYSTPCSRYAMLCYAMLHHEVRWLLPYHPRLSYAKGKGITSSAWSLPRSYSQGIGFTSSAPVFHPMHRAQESRQSSLLFVTMHRAQDPANPTRPPASILCTGQRIHEFRLVTPSILYTGHRIHKFRAGFPIYAQGTGITTVVTPRRHHR